MKGLKDRDVQAYLEYMVDVAVLLGADKTAAKIQMTEALMFEIELAKILLPR